MMNRPAQVAVMIPCLNEEAAIPRGVADFRRMLPEALIFVYDNGSSDRTIEVARSAGVTVRSEPLRGKGNVVRRIFADVEANIYVLVDGDDTYDAASAPGMISKLTDESLDMINGAREERSKDAYRTGHRFGNRMLTGLVA
jgi:glycosyltransferase involved in cell wall biosynthesis